MKSWFTITNKAEETEICINDEIGLWGVSSNDFAEQLRAAGPRNIVINIDSPGGDCNDGFTIYDAIMGCKASVAVNVTGLAASMASVIMLAADKGKLRIAENGRVMIHRVTGGAHGNSDDLAAATQLVRQFEDRIVALYSTRSGKTDAEIRDLMKAQLGTWFFGKDAVEAGFADAVIPGAKARAFKNEWASLFTMLPAALFTERENLIDTPKQSTYTNNMPDEPTAPEPVTPEPSAPVSEPLPEPPAPEPAPIVDSSAIRAEAIKAERKRVSDIRDLAKAITDNHKLDVSAAETAHINEGKTVDEFQRFVLTNKFAQAVPIVTITDAQGAQGNTLNREDFNKLSPFNQADFCRKGGKITD